MPADWVQRWGYTSGEAPPERCGVTVKFPHTDSEGPISDVTCWRESWGDSDYCIWHADRDDKPREELAAARTEHPERLDGAVIKDRNLGSRISFEDCALNGANLKGTNLSHANLSGARLRWADLTNAMLFRTILRNSNLQEAEVQEANLQETIAKKAVAVGADFSHSVATESDFSESHLENSRFEGTDLRGAKMASANISHSTLSNSNLSQADLEGVQLNEGDLTAVSALETDFSGASLENSIFNESDIRGASFNQADIFQTRFLNCRINNNTTFDKKCTYESYDKPPKVSEEIPPLKAATNVYGRLESLYQENSMSEMSTRYHIRRQEAQRKFDGNTGNLGSYLARTLNRALTNHGTSMKNLVAAWAVVIIGSAAVYPFVGGISDSSEVYQIHVTLTWPTFAGVIQAAEVFLRSLYFSVITFSTIGYANVAPRGVGSRVLVGGESLAGGILIALFVYLLGRQLTQ